VAYIHTDCRDVSGYLAINDLEYFLAGLLVTFFFFFYIRHVSWQRVAKYGDVKIPSLVRLLINAKVVKSQL
jgi:hypothetical protein